MDPEALAGQCLITRGRASGPGGQHRNKVETAISILHKQSGQVGQASSYDLRYSTAAITTANWTSATNVAVAAPLSAGSPEGRTVAGLLEGTDYYFAIRASDEVNNTSGLSNVPTGSTTAPPVLDTTAPATVAPAPQDCCLSGQPFPLPAFYYPLPSDPWWRLISGITISPRFPPCGLCSLRCLC